ncbi:MAG: hypothetical protein ABFR90_07600 [Planctomycetota bacterium]
MRTMRGWQMSVVCVVVMALMTPAVMAVDFVADPNIYFVDYVLGSWNTIYDASVTFQVGSELPADGTILTKDGCDVHFENCFFGPDAFLWVGADDTNPVYNGSITFHGTEFKINDVNVPSGTTSIDLDAETLSGYFANGDQLEYFEIYVYIHGQMSVNLVWLDGPSVIDVVVDIKPDSADNTVNLGSMGVIPVGILSTADFDATQVDPWTVELAGADVAMRGKGSKLLSSVKDLNGDGLMDLEVKVETENLDPGQFQDGAADLTGETYGGLKIQGSDIITIVPVE